jgi:hypothetical protein
MPKIPILLLTRDRATLLEKVLERLIKYTDWEKFDLWILDNKSTASNKKIINMFKYRFPFINVYATEYNQLALIQNEVIAKLKADFYIKLDDDILVGKGWTDGFVGVCERNFDKMSFGGVVMPINGFGWVPFMEIMGLTEEFKEKFPGTPMNQACMDVPVFKDKAVNEFLWEHCLDLDATVESFKQRQHGNYQDLICPHRYSIGAIVFTHKSWEKMGGWKVQEGYDNNIKRQIKYQKVANWLKKRRNIPDTYSRLNLLADLFSNTYQGVLGYEEEVVFDYSQQNNLIIPVTTQSVVFHFSFGPVDQHLMNTIYHRIKF